jgi:hypothetical protein
MGLFDWLFGKKSPADEDVPPTPAIPASPGGNWKAGDRVLANWVDAFFYPGRVRQIKGNLYEIAFDDGDAAWVHQANVRTLDIRVGSDVFCRMQAGPLYYPASVRQQNGEKIQVQYENGQLEWTTISMVRVLRPKAGEDVPMALPSQAPVGASPVALAKNFFMLGITDLVTGGTRTATVSPSAIRTAS